MSDQGFEVLGVVEVEKDRVWRSTVRNVATGQFGVMQGPKPGGARVFGEFYHCLFVADPKSSTPEKDMSKRLTLEESRRFAAQYAESSGNDQPPGGNVLTIDEAAVRISTTPRNVNRLLAMEALPFTRLGLTGPRRLMSEAVERYVAAGAPRYDPPNFSRKGEFDVRRHAKKATSLIEGQLEAMIERSIDFEAVQNQINAIAPLINQYVNYPSDVKVPLSAQMKAAILSPIEIATDAFGAEKDDEPLEKFSSVGELFVATAWRVAVVKEIRKVPAPAAQSWTVPVDRLYASIEDYKKFTAAAFDQIRSQPAFFVSKRFARVDHRVFYVVSVGDVLALLNINHLQAVAF